MTSRSGESRDHSVAAGYAVAVIACVTAGAAQYFLRPLFGERFPLAALTAVVVVAAWFGGFGPGLLATLGGTLAGAYVSSRPAHRLQMDDWANAASLFLFTLVGLLISLAVRQLRQQALTERDARVETERQLGQTTHLQQLTATLLRARTPADVTSMCLPALLHAVDATAGAVFLVCNSRKYGLFLRIRHGARRLSLCRLVWSHTLVNPAAAAVAGLISDDGSECELADAVGYDNPWAASARRFPVASGSRLTEAIRRRELVVVETPPMPAVEAEPAPVDRFLEFRPGVPNAGVPSAAAALGWKAAAALGWSQGDVVVPLIAAGRAIGAVALSIQHARTVGGDQREFLLTAGRHTAQALDRARLYETAERARAEAEALRVRADSREIRAMPSARLAGIPAAAVTAHARDDERERALAAGFRMHLTKPIDPAALARAVAVLAANARSTPSD